MWWKSGVRWLVVYELAGSGRRLLAQRAEVILSLGRDAVALYGLLDGFAMRPRVQLSVFKIG